MGEVIPFRKRPGKDTPQLDDESIKGIKQRYRSRLIGLYGNIHSNNVEKLTDTLFSLRFGVDLVINENHGKADYDPRFGAAIAYVLFELAIEEVCRLGICGAIEEKDFNFLISYMKESLSVPQYIEDLSK